MLKPIKKESGRGQVHFNTLIPLLVLDNIDILQVLEYRHIIEKGTAALATERATGNPIIIKVNNVLRGIFEVSMDNIVSTLGIKDGLHYHRLIIDAILARDARAAESIMQEHVDRTTVRLKAEAGLAAPGAT